MFPNQRSQENAQPPLEVLKQIDAICLRFEAAWRGGQRPSLAAYLAELGGDSREALLRELFKLELHYRQARNEYPGLEDYTQLLLPEDIATLETLFRELPSPINTSASTVSLQPDDPGPKISGAPPDQPWPEVPDHVIVDRLGEGAFGTVYLAVEQTALRRLVALKLSRFDAADSDEGQRFGREMQALAELEHPNIIRVYRAGKANSKLFFTMEFVPGGSLEEYLKERKPLPWKRAALLVETLARAIEVAHRKKIIHRDLKPANVLIAIAPELLQDSNNPKRRNSRLLEGDFTLKLTDFGLAKREATSVAEYQHWLPKNEAAPSPNSPESALPLTQYGTLLGTVGYMAPEQALGQSSAVGPPADVYALGAILYRLLTGRAPFEGGNAVAVLTRQLEEKPTSPRNLNRKISWDLAAICLTCLEKEPAARYGSAQELAEDLTRVQKFLPPRVRRLGPSERLYRWAKRHPLLCSVGLLLVTLLVGYRLANYYLDPNLPRYLATQTLARQEPLKVETFPGPFRQVVGEQSPLRDNGAGVATVESLGLVLWELVADPLHEHYQFSVEVRHENSSGVSRVGLYFGYHELTSPKGTPLIRFVPVSYSERGALVKTDAQEKQTSHVELGTYLVDPDPALPQPYLSILTQQKVPFTPEWPLTGPSPWRKISLLVSPQEVKAAWLDTPDGNNPLLLRMSKPQLEESIRLLCLFPPKMQIIPHEVHPRSGLGLFIDSAKASFRNVRLEPLSMSR